MTALNTTQQNTRARKLFGFLLFFILVIFFSPFIGPTKIDLISAWNAKFTLDNKDANILFNIRLPRIILGALTGSALAVAGAIYQALLRNDLAAPFTLGVSSGAALGAVLSIGFNLGNLVGFPTISMSAFLGSLFAIGLVFKISKSKHHPLSTSVLLLAGVTINFFFASMVMLIQYLSDLSQTFEIIHWLMGSLDTTSYSFLPILLPSIVIGTTILFVFSRDLNIISLGEESALSRGVAVGKVQMVGFITASLITAVVVSMSGPIGFIGLIAPHIVRHFVGPDLRMMIPGCILFGAGFLVLCDTAGRTLFEPMEIPVGVITAIVGGPFFLYLLNKKLSVR